MPSNLFTLVAALVLGIGIALAGWFVGDGFLQGRKDDRFVTVKGLAEREVKADLAVWPLRFVVTDDDLNRAHRVSRRLKAGTVSVNTVDALDPCVPFGGGKQSGFGRDLSLHSFDKYTQLKTTWIQLR